MHGATIRKIYIYTYIYIYVYIYTYICKYINVYVCSKDCEMKNAGEWHVFFIVSSLSELCVKKA